MGKKAPRYQATTVKREVTLQSVWSFLKDLLSVRHTVLTQNLLALTRHPVQLCIALRCSAALTGDASAAVNAGLWLLVSPCSEWSVSCPQVAESLGITEFLRRKAAHPGRSPCVRTSQEAAGEAAGGQKRDSEVGAGSACSMATAAARPLQLAALFSGPRCSGPLAPS